MTSASLESLTSGSAKITEMALWDVFGHHVQHVKPMQYLHTQFLVRCHRIFKDSEMQWQPILVSLHIVRCWTLGDGAICHILATFPKLKALSFHHEFGAVPADCVGPRKVTMDGVLALAQGRELSYIGLGGLHRLSRPLEKQLRRLFKILQLVGVAKDPVYVLLPSLSPRKPAVSESLMT